MSTGPDQIERLPRPAAVLLARLLTPVASLERARKDVAEVVGPLDADAWRAALSTLAEGGSAVVSSPAVKATRTAAKPQPLHLTSAGRTAARDRLGAAADRPKFTATTVERFWQHADAKPTATVLLTRLYVPATTPPTLKSLRTAVSKIVGPLDDAAWQAAVTALVEAEYTNNPATPSPEPAAPRPAKVSPIALTEGGRSAVQQWLGMETVPPTLTWAAVRDKWLPAAVVPADERAAFRDDKRVVGLLLGELFGVGPAASVAEAIDAAVCHDIGYPQVRRLADVVPLVLGKRLGTSLPPMSPKELASQVPAVAFNVPKADAKSLRLAALKRWATAGPITAATPRADDLPSFAAAVNRATTASPTGRFGPNKVFINHVHRHLADGSPLEAFKRRLVEANTAGLIALARADLVGAMDPVDVRESETRYLTAEFHFVRIEPGSPS